MHNKTGLILIVCFLLSGFVAPQHPQINNEEILGHWNAYSRNHIALLGEAEVFADRISFEKEGAVAFEVMRATPTEYILKLDKEMKDGRFMRIGAARLAGYRKDMGLEVAFYKTRTEALADRKHSFSNSTSWGMYIRG